jgi:hemoglobin
MRVAVVLAIVVGVAACGGAQGGTAAQRAHAPRAKPLYDRLGGMDGITPLVDELVTIIRADPRINTLFANADLENFKAKLRDQICQATGGPCTYTGKGMTEAHTGMNIRKADFDAFVDDLVQAMRTFGVPDKEQQEVRALLAPMEKDIVQVQ